MFVHNENAPSPDFKGGVVVMPRLYADIKLTAGELRALATKR